MIPPTRTGAETAGGAAGAAAAAPPGAQPRPTASAPEELPRMSLLEHLDELRRRLLRSLVAVLIAFLACWAFARPIFDFLARPIYRFLPDGARLAVLGVPDAFLLYVKVAALAAIFIGAPYLLWEAWLFVSPGLFRRERLWAFPFIVLGTLFFVGGGAFAYYVVFPFAVQFLLQMGDQFEPVITVERYFSFLLRVILGLGLMFELPIVIFLLSQMGVVTPRFLIRHFRWAVVIIFAMAAVVTPTPDVVNLCMFAVPTMLLYLLGVGAAWIAGGNRKERPAPDDWSA